MDKEIRLGLQKDSEDGLSIVGKMMATHAHGHTQWLCQFSDSGCHMTL